MTLATPHLKKNTGSCPNSPWRLETSIWNLAFISVSVLKLPMDDNKMTSLSLWRHVYAADHTQNDRQNGIAILARLTALYLAGFTKNFRTVWYCFKNRASESGALWCLLGALLTRRPDRKQCMRSVSRRTLRHWLCDWLQFFTVDHYSQLAALPPWHLHNFDLFFTFIRMLSTFGMRDHSLVVCKTDRFCQRCLNLLNCC